MVDDHRWTKTYAEPLIAEAAKFYLNNLKKGDDGLWHLHVIPSISLDEMGDINKPDYVSGLISAQYVLQKAIEYGLDSDQRMQLILRMGWPINRYWLKTACTTTILGLQRKISANKNILINYFP